MARIDHERAVAMYVSGMAAAAVAAELGCSGGAVFYALKKLGVEARDGNRKWYFNQRFFENIDSEEKAYWLGFFIADGHIVGNQLGVGLASRDAGHLEKFKAALGLEVPVVTREKTKYSGGTPRNDGTVTRVFNSSVVFGSVLMIEDLARLDVVRRKRRKERAPLGAIPEELRRHFWRGVIDGDGSISIYPDGHARVTLTCSYEICSQFREFVLDNVGLVRSNVNKHGTSFAFAVNVRAVSHALLGVLYADAQVYLDRKYELAHAAGFTASYKATPQPAAKFTFEQAQEIRRRVSSGERQTDVARSTGVSTSVVASIVHWRAYKAPIGKRLVDGVGRLRTKDEPETDTPAP